MGPCQVSVLGHRCPCPAGSYVGGADLNALCNTCRHQLSEHDNYSPPIRLFVPDLLQQAQICPRDTTVEKLAKLVEAKGVVHVRGTPASGKTTLAQLLEGFLRAQGKAVVYLDQLGPKLETQSPASILIAACTPLGFPASVHDIQRLPVTFIIDEVQQTYGTSLWSGVIKTRLGLHEGPNFCLFSSYGSPSYGSTYYKDTTPPYFTPDRRVSLIPFKHGVDFGLFYSWEECEDVIRRHCQNKAGGVPYDTDARGYIYSLTNGHPGMVNSLLNFFDHCQRQSRNANPVQSFTAPYLRSAVQDRRTLFQYLETTVCVRSLPRKTADLRIQNPLVMDVLRKVFIDKSIQFDDKNEGIVTCFKNGWIQRDVWPDDELGSYCTFPTRLHEMFVGYRYCPSTTEPFPITQYPTPLDLYLAVARRFSRHIFLQAAANMRPGPSGVLHRPKEAMFTDEFFRSYVNVVDLVGGICSEWPCGTGAIDICITQQKWGFEFLRDGDRLNEHLDRFRPGGRYHGYIQSGYLTNWLIIDCRHSPPRKKYPGEGKLIRSVFEEDYSALLVLDNNNDEIAGKFAL